MRTTTFKLGTQRRWRLAGVLGLFGTFAASTVLTACVSDPDCGVCDPDNLYLQQIAGVNYAGKIVKLLGPECEGGDCPGEITTGQYFVEKVIPCIETKDAIEAGRGHREWCKVSPLVVDSGLQFIFNNLLDPQSVELTRKQPANPQLLEVFDWKTHIVHLEGPTTRFNGDYREGPTQTKPDTITRSTNLSCIENLAKSGQGYDHTVDPTICDGFYTAEDKTTWPLKASLQRESADGKMVPTTIETFDGETDHRRQSQACTTPQNGPDTCCDACDYELSVNVWKYGAKKEGLEAGADRREDMATFSDAIACDPTGDKYSDCADFIPYVDRSQEVRHYDYKWFNEKGPFRLPLQDRLRETHPDDRPDIEQRTVPCTQDADCTSADSANLPGMECIGRDGEGKACATGDDCVDKKCEAEWFVDCRAETSTTGSQGYCVDARWSGQGTAACFNNNSSFYVCGATESCITENDGNKNRYQGSGSRFAYADTNTNGKIEAIEGCRDKSGRILKDGDGNLVPCDPLIQNGDFSVSPIARYDRKDTLPTATRKCVCPDFMRNKDGDFIDEKGNKVSKGVEEPLVDGCEDVVAELCRKNGDPAEAVKPERRGQYAMKFISRNGGVIYDPAVKGVLFQPADIGLMTRALVEVCSAGRANGAGALSIKDGWRANDNGGEIFANYDKAMCSSSTYRVLFNTEEQATPNNPVEYIKDKVGNTLRGKREYVLHTPDFHVIPGSGFPTDNLRIGACDDFEIRFSNKYDMSELNLKKLELHEISLDQEPKDLGVVAGGIDCAEDPDTSSGVPCLTINVRDQDIGAVRVSINTQLYGADVLVSERRYRLVVPGIKIPDDVYVKAQKESDQAKSTEIIREYLLSDPVAYKEAFWDACGLPLVTSMPPLDPSTGEIKAGGKSKSADFYYDFSIDRPKPKEDKEQDGVQFSCDNSPDFYNPGQEDMDEDGYGDVDDLCPSVPQQSSTADTDKDGIGNTCDLCTRQPAKYNTKAAEAGAPVYMQVRNIPLQRDFDEDGIGDVCDNCIVRGNCGPFGPDADGLRPASIGDVVPFDDNDTCQVDTDALPFVGDACFDKDTGKGLQLEGAAGPVGHLDTDDFDQDGIANIDDYCPRIRSGQLSDNYAIWTCTEDTDCVLNSPCDGDECVYAKCTSGVCNHADTDGDLIGDLCDTCPSDANSKQTLDGGMQEDDPDNDFVGNVCETNSSCYERTDPRPMAFYDKVSNGQCCVMLFNEENEFLDPGYVTINEDTGVCEPQDKVVPIKRNCPEDQENVTCRKLPESVATTPGVGILPPGCTGVGNPLTLDSPGINRDSDELHKYACLMPQFDQDFDGVGDECDLCPYAFDPNNEFFKDENNKLWPNYGKFCKGQYDPEKEQSTCEDASEDTDTDTDTDTDGGTAGTTGG